jgi:hypothetical protein
MDSKRREYENKNCTYDFDGERNKKTLYKKEILKIMASNQIKRQHGTD